MDTKARDIVRSGVVSATFPERNSARVTFEDKDDNVSAELRILNSGSLKNKHYWMPDVGDEVVCIYATNDENYGTGWIIGACYNKDAVPRVHSQDKMRIDFADGTWIEYDRSSHELNINCIGDIRIKGKNIFLNE